MNTTRLTTPNIKVRRLGYFVLLTKILNEYRALPEISLIREFEEISLKYIEFFKRYPYKSNRETPIKPTKKHDGSKRYIRTAEEIELIAKMANEYYITKLGDIIASLPSRNNPFRLSLSQQCFFLKLLLKKDRDTLIPIVKIIREKIDASNRWKFFIKYIAKKGNDLRWKKNPKKYYMDHIESPRLGWLKDLKILTPNGIDERFLSFFSEKIFERDPDLTIIYYQEFCKAKRFKNIKEFDKISPTEKSKILKRYLQECYELFKLPGIWRLSANQFFEYSTCVMLCRDNILATFSSLEKAFTELFDYNLFPFKLRKVSTGEDIGFIVKIV